MAHKIDTTKGQMVGTVSAQWANRSADQRFTSLTDLRAQVALWAEQSSEIEVKPNEIEAVYNETDDDSDWLGLTIKGEPVEATHWSFDQIASAAGAPAAYLRKLPPALAATNLNYGLQAGEQKKIEAYVKEDGKTTLRGITSTKYGRILDRDVADAVAKIAGNGTGDTRWKVPGCIDWNNAHGIHYNPEVDITKQNTTLYASDRDIFLFLVDDKNPIEVGKLADGSPDLMFRGFYTWNSEVGCRTFGYAQMYLRGVCQNRNLWGVEGFQQIVFKHSSGAPGRFIKEAVPALNLFAEASTSKLVTGVKLAKAKVVAKKTEEQIEFLQGQGFSEKTAKLLIATSEAEEGKPPTTLWDMAQAISAQARQEELQEARLTMERIAGKLLDRIKVDA